MNGDTSGKDGWGAARATRRQMMKKGLALGSAAYVAPMIVGAVTPVSAQGVSNPSPGCAGASCGNFIACSGTNCFCWTLSTGGGFCGLDFSCGGAATCTGVGNTCPAGSVCTVNTCCGAPTCTLISTLCASIPAGNRAPSSTSPSVPAPGSGLAASGKVY
jgi:hypothetical protein